MNYKKFFAGLLIMTVITVGLFLLIGCGGGDCGFNCDGGPACGLACNGHGGCVGQAFCDGCTPIGISVCDACGSCVGLGIEDGDLYLESDKESYITAETAFLRAVVSGSSSNDRNYSEAAFINIVEDTTGKAKLKRVENGFELTTSRPGSVTIEAKLGDYSDTITIQFFDSEQVLADFNISFEEPSGTLYVGNEVWLSVYGNHTLISIEQERVQYTLLDNSANAQLTDGRRLIARNEGSVTVEAAYSVDDRTFTTQITLHFSPAQIALTVSDTQSIGDRVILTYSVSPADLYSNANNRITYEVISGNATVSYDETTDEWYIISTEEGDVELRLTYQSGSVSLSSTGLITFTKRGFSISVAPDQQLYAGYDVALNAECGIEGFDPSRVVYTVVEGQATVNGNILCAEDAGAVKVLATYDHNGATLESNILELSFQYDANTIRTPEDLQMLVDSESTFNLIADLDLSAYDTWTPIGGFKGTLRGNGHTISGLNLHVSNLETDKGLFSILEGTVINLTISGTITANGEASNLGLLCGQNRGAVKNVTAIGSISAEYSSYVGGIIGYSNTSYITDCTSSVTITAKQNAGGIAGHVMATRAADAVIIGNKNTGNITGTTVVGGLFGSVFLHEANNRDEIIMTKNTNEGTVAASGECAGGVVGWIRGEGHDVRYDGNYTSYIKITECTNSADVSGTDRVGGIAGYCEYLVSEISFSTNTGNISGNLFVGGYAGQAVNTTMKNLNNNQTITGKAYLGGIAGYAGKLDSCVNNGTLTVVGFHLDENSTMLSYVGGIAGFATSAVGCTNNQNIDASSGGYYVGGIAGYVSATRSQNAEFKNNQNHGEIVGTSYVGGIFGEIAVQYVHNQESILITTNTNDAPVIGLGDRVGGIIGHAKGESHDVRYEGTFTSRIKITDCNNTAAISGVDWVGGIVGDASYLVEEISFSSNTGDVTGNLYVGGYAGRGAGTAMRNLKNSNSITGRAYIGGIAGVAGKLDTCENNGTITNTGYHLDDANNPLSYVGGIAGYATASVNCTNNSSVEVVDGGHYVGGIVGYLAASRSDDETLFSGNKNHADVSGSHYVGGLFGTFAVEYANNSLTVTIKSNANDGTVTGSTYVGGIVGHALGETHDIRYEGTFTAYVKFLENANNAAIYGIDYVGGIVGSGSYLVSEIAFCTHSGDVSGKLYVGGFAGYAQNTAMRNLTNSSTISGKAFVGGIAGQCGLLDACTNNGELRITGYHLTDDNTPVSYVGGIAGYATSATNCTNNADLDVPNGGHYVGGIAGYVAATRTDDTSYFSGNTNHGDISGTNYVGGLFGDFAVVWANNSATLTVKNNINDGTVKGTNYVGGIAGHMMGESHEIRYEGTFTSHIKLFENANDASITGTDYVGGIVGSASYLVSEITFCTHEGAVTGSLYVGGFAGYANNTAMVNLNNSTLVSGKAYLGGIAGQCGKMENCSNSGNIFALGYQITSDNVPVSYVGGLAGFATGAANCSNTSAISVPNGGYYVGGVAGYLQAIRSAGSPITGNRNQGEIIGSSYVGGLFGIIEIQYANNSDTIELTENANSGNVTASGQYVGGIVGLARGETHTIRYEGTFTSYIKVMNNTSNGYISGADYAGGIVGYCETLVVADTVVWDTNVVIGKIWADSGNAGNHYGALS